MQQQSTNQRFNALVRDEGGLQRRLTWWVLGLVMVVGLALAAFLAGRWYQQQQTGPISSASQHTATSSATQPSSASSQPDPYAGWTAYQGKTYTFKYPPGWSVREQQGPLGTNVIVSCTSCDSDVNVDTLYVNLVVSKSIDQYVNSSTAAHPTANYMDTTVSGLPAVRGSWSSSQSLGSIDYFVVKNDQGYSLTYAVLTRDVGQVTEVRPDIVSTFSFK